MKKKLLSLLIVLMLTLSVFTVTACDNLSKNSKKLSTYNIDAVYDEATQSVTARQTVEYVNNTGASLFSVEFHLYGNAYREGAKFSPIQASQAATAYPNGRSFGDMTVAVVKVDGAEKAVKIGGSDEDILIVSLDKELKAKAKTSIEIEFCTKLANVSHRLGYLDGFVNLGNWFPIASVYENGGFLSTPYYSNGDPFYSDFANFNVSFKVPSTYIVASTGDRTGETQETTDNGSFSTFRYSATVVRDFAAVFSKNFSVASRQSGNTTVNYYYYRDTMSERSLDTAVLSLETFNDMIGEYPYKTLNVVETTFLNGGMEYPNLVYISNKVSGLKYQEVIVHEVAHQWWYGIVGSNQIASPWLDEGLTEYTTTLFFEKHADYGSSRSDRIAETLRNYLVYVDVYDSLKKETDTTMTRASNEYTSEFEYVYMTYVKGELMFDTLRTTIGDKAFFNGLKKYFNNYQFTSATPADLISSFEKSSKTNLSGFFSSWLDGKVVIGN